MPLLHDLRQNHLLADLPAADLAAIEPMLERVALRLGDVIYGPGMPLRHALFPTTAVISLHYVTEDGETAETAGVGLEGLVGIALFMGGLTTTGSAVVRNGGHAWRMKGEDLARAFAGGGLFQLSLLRYAQALITQVAQTAACFRHHSVVQQLSRWLLTSADRMPGAELVITQDLVAGMLGVRRESITMATGDLQRAGHIECRRGHIRVLDPLGLETRACECYGVVKSELQRLRGLHGGGVRGMPATS